MVVDKLGTPSCKLAIEYASHEIRSVVDSEWPVGVCGLLIK